MTRHSELLRCPTCGRPLATYDGLGAPTPPDLAAWREVLAEHRPVCPMLGSPGQRATAATGS